MGIGYTIGGIFAPGWSKTTGTTACGTADGIAYTITYTITCTIGGNFAPVFGGIGDNSVADKPKIEKPVFRIAPPPVAFLEVNQPHLLESVPDRPDIPFLQTRPCFNF